MFIFFGNSSYQVKQKQNNSHTSLFVRRVENNNVAANTCETIRKINIHKHPHKSKHVKIMKRMAMIYITYVFNPWQYGLKENNKNYLATIMSYKFGSIVLGRTILILVYVILLVSDKKYFRLTTS